MGGQIPSAKSTGGGGFVFETKVAAYYMTLMLSARSPFAPEFAPELGHVTRIDFQARHDGWLLDDLLLVLADADGAVHRTALSVRSNAQFSGGKAPSDFVQSAWEQYLGEGTSVFDAACDRLGLVTTRLSTKLRDDLDTLLTMTQRRPAADLPAAISSKAQKKLFESFGCPNNLASKYNVKDSEQGQLISRLEFPEFDFESPSSQDEGKAVLTCLSLLERPDQAEAAKLWERLCAIADNYRPYSGSLDRRTLIAQLQGFQLKEYPLYQHDWQTLMENARDTIGSIPNTIGGVTVTRHTLLTDLKNLVSANRCLAVLGTSGCGKSAVVKEFAENHLAAQTVLWWHASVFDDVPDYAAFERNLGIQHRLGDVLQNTSYSIPVVVIDGIDRIYQDKAYRTLAALISNLGSQSPDNPWRIVVTCQSEEWERVRKRLVDVNLGDLAWRSLVVKDFQPDTEDLSPIWDRYPSLYSLFQQDRLRPILCKPVVLNALAVNAAGLSEDVAKKWFRESDIIDWFWDSVVRRREPAAIRSEMLMVLGEKQADRLEHDVPEGELPNLEHLSELKQDGLCVGRPHDRITFYHDIYGDWARLRRLVQLGEDAVPFVKQRLESPMWQKAIRLYSLHLLEQDDGLTQWQSAFDALRSDGETGNTGQELFLEATIFATDAQTLERASTVLLADDGKLLLTLLRRFLHVATFPDPRMQTMAQQQGWDVYETVVQFRVPDWPLWPGVLLFLHRHREEVVKLAAGTVSEVAAMWLRETPVGWPLRRESAELGVMIAERVLHAEPVVGRQVGDYRAGLAGAHEFAERVAAFTLEAAGRADTSLGVTHPVRRRARSRAGGTIEPWPDGPRSDVDHDFQELCLSPHSTSAIYPLIDANPAVAREVLLALLISPHQEGKGVPNYESTSYDDLGIQQLPRYFPPMYHRGPFLYFLRNQPQEGLELIIRLVNFATDRWAERFIRRGSEPPSLRLGLPERGGDWVGDFYVYHWNVAWGSIPYVVVCSLMALEKWLYDRADADEPLDQVISTIHTKGHSLALAGVLCALGKKKPELFSGPLLPYLGVAELHQWEISGTIQSSWSWAQIGWGMEPEWLRRLAEEWHNAEHRLYGMDGWAIELFLTNQQVRVFLQAAAEKWKVRLKTTTDPGITGWLEPLVPKFDLANYHRVIDENGLVYIQYQQPVKLQQKYAPRLQEIDKQSRLRSFVLRCRQILDEQLHLEISDVDQFWQELQTVSALVEHEESDSVFFSNRDARCAGAAVLVEFHLQWLNEQPERLAWCKQQLVEAVLNPPDQQQQSLDYFAGDDLAWDRFCSRAMPTLWQRQPESAELTRCVALLVLGSHTNSIASLFWSAARYRISLGDRFRQLQHLLLRYASVRLLCDDKYYCYNPEFEWEKWRQDRVEAFVNGKISPNIPAWEDVMQEEFVPSKRIEEAQKAYAEFTGDPVETQKPILDTMLIQAGYSWLPDISQALNDGERAEWIAFWNQALDYSLMNHAQANLPYSYDRWVLGRIARTIIEMQPSEDPRLLWEPVLALGTNAEHWVETFLDYWFGYGLGGPEVADGFREQWIEMLEFAFSSATWDPEQSGSWYGTLELWTRLMGLWVSTAGPRLWTETRTTLVVSMQDYYERWCRAFLRYGHCAERYAGFLSQPAAARIRIRSLVWLQSGANVGGDYWWKEHDMADSLAHLLTVVWDAQQSELKQNQPAFAAFMSFHTRLAAQLNKIALELESRM